MTIGLTPGEAAPAIPFSGPVPLALTAAGEAAADAAAHLKSLDEAYQWWESHPAARLPRCPVISVPVRGTTRDERLADLYAIAASWDTEVVPLGKDGNLGSATRLVFGGYTYEAHVAAQFKTHDDCLAAHAAARAAAEAAMQGATAA